MTNEEALNWFKDDLKNGKCSDECPQCNAMEKAIEALEKQIPKKPRVSFQSGFFWCPSCERAIKRIIEDSKINISYCQFCGQAIDWKEAEMNITHYSSDEYDVKNLKTEQGQQVEQYIRQQLEQDEDIKKATEKYVESVMPFMSDVIEEYINKIVQILEEIEENADV